MIGLILLIIPGLIVLTWWCLFAPVIVIERAGVTQSFGRSHALVIGNRWRTFSVIVVTFLILVVAGQLLQALANGISDTWVTYLFASAIANVLTAPIGAIAVSVLYFELRDLQQGTQGLYGAAPPPRV